LILLRGDWAFRCELSGSIGKMQQVIWLTGKLAGQISGVPADPCMAVVPEVTVDFRVSRPSAVQPSNAPRINSLAISAGGGQELWGHILGAPEHVYGFDSSGQQVFVPNDYTYMCFDEFEVWLKFDGKDIGSEPLIKY